MPDYPIHNYREILLKYCQQLTGSRPDAEDLSQDTWLRALPGIHLHDNPKAYLFRIAKNAWIDQCRKQRRAAESGMGQQSQEAVHIDSTEIIDAMTLLVRHLTPLQGVVFLLSDVFDLSAPETAKALGTTQGAVKAALHRARHNLAHVKEADRLDTSAEAETQHALLDAYVAAFRRYDIGALVQIAIRHDVGQPVQPIQAMAA